MDKQILTQSRLKEILDYDPDTGLFRRKDTGKVTNCKTKAGYIVITVSYAQYKAHRLAWLYMYGTFPDYEIDHINHVRHDNSITNLREVVHAENHKNKRLYIGSSSGCAGVTWMKSRAKWQVHIRLDGELKFLGYYSELDDAIQVRKSAEKGAGYHDNHGKID